MAVALVHNGCSSYHQWKEEKEHGTSQPSAAEASGAAQGTSSTQAGSGSVGDAVRGAGQEAGDAARATHEVVKMEGQAAGKGQHLVDSHDVIYA